MIDRRWALMLLASGLANAFIAYIVLVPSQHEGPSVESLVSRVHEAQLLDFGLLVGTNVGSSLMLASFLTVIPGSRRVHRACFVVSLLHCLAFLWGVVFGGYPLLIVLGAFSALTAWQYRQSMAPSSRRGV